MKVDVSEVYALADDLEALPGKLRAQAPQAVRAQVDETTRAAQQLAPVDTGALRESIRGTVKGLEGTVEATIRYAPYVEFGTAFTPAQPYMEPAGTAAEAAFEAKAQQVLDQVANAL